MPGIKLAGLETDFLTKGVAFSVLNPETLFCLYQFDEIFVNLKLTEKVS